MSTKSSTTRETEATEVTEVNKMSASCTQRKDWTKKRRWQKNITSVLKVLIEMK